MTLDNNVPSRTTDYLTKTPVLGTRNFSSCWSMEPKRLPKQQSLLLFPLAASQKFKVSP